MADSSVVSWVLANCLNPAFLTGIGCGLGLAWTLMKSCRLRGDNKQLSIANDSNTVEEMSGYAEGDCKLIIVVRTDLKMGKGKVAAQCSHAAVSAYRQASKRQPQILEQWEECGQPKIIVKTDSESCLLELAASARHRGLITSLIKDAGRTQIEPGSRTVLGVGPGPSDLVDAVTSHLKLF